MIKKYSRFICIVLMMCMFLPNVSTKANSSEDAQLDKAFSLLSALGIVSADAELEKIDIDGTVTRAEFAVYFASMLNIDVSNRQSLYYNDLPRTHYAYNEITTLTEMKYLFGSDKKFYPDEPMVKEHAISLLLRTIGPAEFLNSDINNTTFINGLINDSNLLDGVTIGGNVTYRDMFLMLFNTLKADCYRWESMQGSDINYGRVEGYSVLYKTRGMYYVENKTATAINGADIYGVSERIDDVVIDGVLYNSNGTDYSELLGRRVDFVYAEEDEKIIWMHQRKKGQEMEIFFDEECRYDAQSRRIYYSDGVREKSVELAANIKVVYNGKYVGSGISEILSTPKYKLTLLELENSGDYDVAIIDAYYNILVGEKNDKKLCLYDKNDGTMLNLNHEDYSLMKILSSEGEAISFEDIQVDTILSVFKSKNGDFLKVKVSSETVSGRIEKIVRDTVQTVSIDGVEYKVYSNGIVDTMVLGATVTAYLDCMGYIATADISFTNENQFVGFAVKGYYDSFDEVIGITILSETSSVDKYTLKEKVNINGKNYRNMAEAYTLLAPSGKFEQTLLLVTLNDEGGIRRIDTPSIDDGKAHPLTISKKLDNNLSSKWQATYRATQGKIGLTMLATSATKVFYIPENFTDVKQCSVGKPVDESDYRGAISYRTSSDTFYEQYIVVRRSLGTVITDTSGIVMISKIKSGLNADDELVDIIVCNNGRQEFSYEVPEEFDLESYALKKGDAVQLGFDGEGLIDDVKVLYRAGSNGSLDGNGGHLWPDKEGRIITCYANDKSGNALKVGWSSANNFDEIFNLSSSTPIVVFDSEDNTVEIGTIGDIKKSKTNGNNASKLLIQTNYSALNQILVYN